MRSARRCLTSYSHHKSPHKFTQPQLTTRLDMLAKLKTIYRDIIEILENSEELCRRMALERLHHYSTLKRFAYRSNVAEITGAVLADKRRSDSRSGRRHSACRCGGCCSQHSRSSSEKGLTYSQHGKSS